MSLGKEIDPVAAVRAQNVGLDNYAIRLIREWWDDAHALEAGYIVAKGGHVSASKGFFCTSPGPKTYAENVGGGPKVTIH